MRFCLMVQQVSVNLREYEQMIANIIQLLVGLALTIFTACFNEKLSSKFRMKIYLLFGAVLLITGINNIYCSQEEATNLLQKNTLTLNGVKTLLSQIHWRKLSPKLELMKFSDRSKKLEQSMHSFQLQVLVIPRNLPYLKNVCHLSHEIGPKTLKSAWPFAKGYDIPQGLMRRIYNCLMSGNSPYASGSYASVHDMLDLSYQANTYETSKGEYIVKFHSLSDRWLYQYPFQGLNSLNDSIVIKKLVAPGWVGNQVILSDLVFILPTNSGVINLSQSFTDRPKRVPVSGEHVVYSGIFIPPSTFK